MLKKYQVAERRDGMWDVVLIGSMEEKKEFYCAVVTPHEFPSQHTAAEAQELADELNEANDDSTN